MNTIKRISALHDNYPRGDGHSDRHAGVVLREVPDLCLHQITAWHDTHPQVANIVARAATVTAAPAPCKVTVGEKTLLRVAPLKWWLLGDADETVINIAAELGTYLDISHSRTHLQISGAHAAELLNRHLALDLRTAAFPEHTVASSVMHHIGVTVWHSPHGYELFIPRGFAVSLWEVLLESAAQFGVEVA